MQGRVSWIHQQQARIGFDELSSMVCELMQLFEREADAEGGTPILKADWVSDSGLTRIVRHGSSASLQLVLQQEQDAVAAEFEILHCGSRVFAWSEYLWPGRQRRHLSRQRQSVITLPQTCLQELLQFHESRDSSWLSRYRHKRSEQAIAIDQATPSLSADLTQIDEVGIVAESDRLQLL